MTNVLDRAVADAQARSDAARARLLGTANTLRRRLTPGALASSALGKISRKTESLLDSAQSSAKRNPLTAGGGLAAFMVAVSLRIWLSRQKTTDIDETTP